MTTTHKDRLAFLLKHEHPAGKAWGSGVSIAHSCFDAIKATRAPETFDLVLNDALAKDVNGDDTDWLLVVPGENALLDLVKGKANLEVYRLFFHKVIQRHKGTTFAATLGELKFSVFWTSEPAMRACKDIFARVMALVGFQGKEANSFTSFYSGIYRRLDRIVALPDWVEEKLALLAALGAAANAAWEEHMEHARGLHKEPLDYMKQRAGFVSPTNKAASMIAKLDKVMVDVVQRTDILETYGLQPASSGAAMGDALSTRSVMSYSPAAQRQVKTKTKWDEMSSRQTAKDAGSANARTGTYRSVAGLVFNGNILVTWNDTSKWTLAGALKGCLACYAPNKYPSGRHKYCTMNCGGGEGVHDRYFPDEEFTVLYLDQPSTKAMPGFDEWADPSNWTWVAGADTRDELKVTFDWFMQKLADPEAVDDSRTVTWDSGAAAEGGRRGQQGRRRGCRKPAWRHDAGALLFARAHLLQRPLR